MVALLRGINVGGANKVAMADLRALVAGLGHRAVATYINSGNVVFTNGAPELDTAAVAAVIAERIESDLGLTISVVVRTADELAEVLAANPFPDADPARLLFSFLLAEPTQADIDRLTAVESGADEFRVSGTTVYLHCPDGIGRSKLAAALAKPTGLVGTARNLATVGKLYDMARGEETQGTS